MPEPLKLPPILPLPVDELCIRCECPNRIAPPRARIIHRLKITVVQVLFLLVCSAFLGGNLAMKVHAQGNTRDINTLDIAVNAEKLADVTARVNANDGKISDIYARINHIDSQISTIDGMGIAFPAFFILLQVVQIVMGRKQP